MSWGRSTHAVCSGGRVKASGTQGKNSWYVGVLGPAKSWAWGQLVTDGLGPTAPGEVG